MKRYIYTMLALVAMLASSCSNEEIAVDVVEVERPAPAVPTHNLTVYVNNPQGIYDHFGISYTIKKDYLAPETHAVGIYNFVYDENENLVAADSTYKAQFERATFSFDNLKEGKYTVITLEMLVSADEHKSEQWEILTSQKQSTLRIGSKTDIINETGIIGLEAKEIQVEANTTLETETAPIGTLINAEYMQFNQQNEYYIVEFVTRNTPTAMYLSPKYYGADRYEFIYSPNRYMGYRQYINLKAFKSYDSQYIYLAESGEIECGFGPISYNEDGFYVYPAQSDNHYTMLNVKDGDMLYGGICYVGGEEWSNCKAFIGAKTEYEAWKKNTDFSVTNPFVFAEPYVKWGASPDEVKNYMKRNSNIPIYKDMEYVEDQESDYYQLVYYHKYSNVYYQYVFPASTMGLDESYLFFIADYNDVVAHYMESYTEIKSGIIDGIQHTIMRNAQKTVAMQIEDHSDKNFILVFFAPYNKYMGDTKVAPQMKSIKAMGHAKTKKPARFMATNKMIIKK